MISPISTIDIAPFGAYSSYLASRLGGLKTARGLNQFEAYGKYTEFSVGDGDGEESMDIGSIGNAMKPSAGALRETPVELGGNMTWD